MVTDQVGRVVKAPAEITVRATTEMEVKVLKEAVDEALVAAVVITVVGLVVGQIYTVVIHWSATKVLLELLVDVRVTIPTVHTIIMTITLHTIMIS